jgi:hypothetical protein
MNGAKKLKSLDAVIEALSTTRSHSEAAKCLGVSRQALTIYIKKNHIVLDHKVYKQFTRTVNAEIT